MEKNIAKALFSEYVADHFGNYTEVREGTALDYEAEYILSGKDNDRDNLSSVVTNLCCPLRSQSDRALLDSTKQAEIKELAAAVSCGNVCL